MKFPHIVSHRNHQARIYARSPRTNKYRVFWYADGRRCERQFSTLKEAKEGAKSALREIAQGQAGTAALTPKEVKELKLAQSALREAGVSVLDAVTEYVSAKKLIPNTRLEVAARAWKENTTEIKRASIRQVADEYLTERRGKIGHKTLYEEENRLKRVCNSTAMDLCDLTKATIELFFDGELKDLKGKSRNHYRQTFRQLFKFAVRRDYLSPEHRLGEVLVNEPTNEAAPEILGPDVLRRMLESATAEMLPYVASAAFTGARRSEILRMTWEDVWSIEGFLELESRKTKTKRRRLVPMCSALEKWLASYRKHSGPIWKGTEGCFHSQCQILMKECGVTGQNLLRHSYASYRLALTSDPNKVATELGNSPEKLYTNYNKLRTPAQAEAWFSVVPREEINIIPAYAS